MHYSPYSEASGIFVNKLLKRDDELVFEMSRNESDIKNIYRIYRERLSLYERAASMPLIEDDRLFLEHRKNQICCELKEYRTMQNRKMLEVFARND